MNNDRPLAARAIRIIPTTLICAVLGCAIGFFGFHVTFEYLPVAVLVPLTWAFLISRILKVVVPTKSEQPNVGTPTPVSRGLQYTLVALALLIAFGGYGAITFLFSSGTFALLGLQSLTFGALRIAEFLGVLGIASLVILALFILGKVAHMHSDKLARWAWQLLSIPQWIADCFRDFGEHHFARHQRS